MEEGLINAATAISGSGPAYIFYDLETRGITGLEVPTGLKDEYVELLKQAARAVGFDAQTAFELSACTVSSSIHLATGNSATELKKRVASKGGTTEEALKVLSAGGTWVLAAAAAKKRAEELSR
jgi:pyrroline-5-carboxylate reductase